MKFRSVAFLAGVTPPPSGGGGDVTYRGMATNSSGSLNPFGSGIIMPKPTGTQASDLLIAVRRSSTSGRVSDLVPGSGWTAITGVYDTAFSDEGFALWWAPGNVADNAWLQGTQYGTDVYFDVYGFIGADLSAPTVFQSTISNNQGTADITSPAVTATEGSAILALYRNNQNTTAFAGSPTAGYTRVLDSDASGTRCGALVRDAVAAGSTGAISHNATGAWESRVAFTLMLEPA